MIENIGVFATVLASEKGILAKPYSRESEAKSEHFNILSIHNMETKPNQELASLRDWLLPLMMNGQVTFAKASVTEGEEIGQEGEVGAAAEGRELYS